MTESDDDPAKAIVAGNPARLLRKLGQQMREEANRVL